MIDAVMILCEKCGQLSFYDPYFKRYVCTGCNHSQKIPAVNKRQGNTRRVSIQQNKRKLATVR